MMCCVCDRVKRKVVFLRSNNLVQLRNALVSSTVVVRRVTPLVQPQEVLVDTGFESGTLLDYTVDYGLKK